MEFVQPKKLYIQDTQKAIIVTGEDTRLYKDELKHMGLKFISTKNHVGWMSFPEYRNVIQAYIDGDLSFKEAEQKITEGRKSRGERSERAPHQSPSGRLIERAVDTTTGVCRQQQTIMNVNVTERYNN